MRKKERQRQLKELKKIEEGKEVKRFGSPTLTKIEELRELFGVKA